MTLSSSCVGCGRLILIWDLVSVLKAEGALRRKKRLVGGKVGSGDGRKSKMKGNLF